MQLTICAADLPGWPACRSADQNASWSAMIAHAMHYECSTLLSTLVASALLCPACGRKLLALHISCFTVKNNTSALFTPPLRSTVALSTDAAFGLVGHTAHKRCASFIDKPSVNCQPTMTRLWGRLHLVSINLALTSFRTRSCQPAQLSTLLCSNLGVQARPCPNC